MHLEYQHKRDSSEELMFEIKQNTHQREKPRIVSRVNKSETTLCGEMVLVMSALEDSEGASHLS